MSAADRRAKAQKTAADLIKRGFPHGRRASRPTHANYPSTGEVGSAAYRRLMAKNRKRNERLGIVEPLFKEPKQKPAAPTYNDAA